MADQPWKVAGNVADGASAVANQIDTGQTLSTGGALILQVLNAGTEVANIDHLGNYEGGLVRIVHPDEGGAGIAAAITELDSLGGGTVQLLAGTYSVTNGNNVVDSPNNIILQGVGEATLLDVDSTGSLTGSAAINLGGDIVRNASSISNVTHGDATVTYTTASDAGFIQAGDRLQIFGLDGDGINEREWHIAAANGDGGTGVVQLEGVIQRTMTSASMSAQRNGANNIIRRFRITHSAGPSASAILSNFGFNTVIEDIIVDEWNQVASVAINAGSDINTVIRGIYAINTNAQAIQVLSAHNPTIENCNVLNPVIGAGGNQAGIEMRSSCRDGIIRDCLVQNSGNEGISLRSISGADPRACRIDGCVVSGSAIYGIVMQGTNECTAINNFVDNCENATAFECGDTTRCLIANNHTNGCVQGVRLQGGEDTVIDGNIFINGVGAGGVSLQSGAVRTVVSNNTINGGFNRGVYLADADDSIVTGNIISNMTLNGIGTISANCSITNNRIIDSTTDGINVQGGADGTFINGNHITGSGGVAIDDNGTNTVLGVNAT